MRKIGNIKVLVGYNEVNNFHYYQNFEIVDELPKIGDEFEDSKVLAINPVNLDSDQLSYIVYSYDYYVVTLSNDGSKYDVYNKLFCVSK